MAKNPVLPLYYNDILGATKTWTDEEFGAYLRLLIEQWDKGGLPKDCQRLARLITSMDANWPMLKGKFEEIDGMLKNRRMEEVREEKARHSQKQKDNAVKRYQKSTKLPANDSAKHVPLEGEVEIEEENEIEKKGVQGETEIESRLSAALDDRTLEAIRMSAGMAYPGVDIDREAARFRLKVTQSPRVYADHDTGGLRLAFNAQLRSAIPEKPKNPNHVNGKRNTNSAEQIDSGTVYGGKL